MHHFHHNFDPYFDENFKHRKIAAAHKWNGFRGKFRSYDKIDGYQESINLFPNNSRENKFIVWLLFFGEQSSWFCLLTFVNSNNSFNFLMRKKPYVSVIQLMNVFGDWMFVYLQFPFNNRRREKKQPKHRTTEYPMQISVCILRFFFLFIYSSVQNSQWKTKCVSTRRTHNGRKKWEKEMTMCVASPSLICNGNEWSIWIEIAKKSSRILFSTMRQSPTCIVWVLTRVLAKRIINSQQNIAAITLCDSFLIKWRKLSSIARVQSLQPVLLFKPRKLLKSLKGFLYKNMTFLRTLQPNWFNFDQSWIYANFE